MALRQSLVDRLRHLPLRGLNGVAFWLALLLGALSLLRLLPVGSGVTLVILQVLAGLALLTVLVPILWRQVRRKLLWSLRNQLIVTYLLIGMAPVVLFVTLVMISSYIAAGQFAIHLADSRLERELDWLSAENASVEGRIVDNLRKSSGDQRAGATAQLDQPADTQTLYTQETRSSRERPELGAFLDSVPLLPRNSEDAARVPLGLPPWALRLPSGSFRGLVLEGGDLFLVSIHQHGLPGGRRFSLVSSWPVDEKLMGLVAEGLGKAGMVPLRTGGPRRVQGATSREKRTPSSGAPAAEIEGQKGQEQAQRNSRFGGSEPLGENMLDLRVRFLSTLPVADWDTGETSSVPIEVVSRPSLLYRQLFGGSLSGIVTSVIRIGLLLLCMLFALIEALALWMAVRLSRTVTLSVADLYVATQSIDRGDLSHRIQVEREDQLANLALSFNRMTGSLQRLLQEQKEKERLQNEISIAQEVQANLFPQKLLELPKLQLHGVCRPARSVSGDYYDFLLFEERSQSGSRPEESGVGIALGDISGKGISAALLMATLHSAVRSYRFVSEELADLAPGDDLSANGAPLPSRCSELFQSPGRILGLLNRHLYRSTQPEKYATLFLAHYDAESATLTYSNAGQLPPLVLSEDGTIRRLDCGGTVVGLLDGMSYEEDQLLMRSGDLLVAYSDGVTEPENDFGDFGEERLMDVVRRYRNEPLHVISAQVMQALDAWIGAEEQPDDITLVLARQL